MPNTNSQQMLSVKELNEVLEKLQSNERISNLGIFSQVDIVFVAGLFLWYMQRKNNWIKIPYFFNLTENDNAYNHSHYFKQLEELYGVKHNDIFVNFKNAQNQKANLFSEFFVPPIYITKKSIDNFFLYHNDLEAKWKSLFELKKTYCGKFDISDFVNISFKEFTSNQPKFKKYETEILRRLENAAPICVFTFVVTCKRLSQKEKRTFNQTKEYLEKIWLFTQTYISGLHELAKNIVEHSGQGENDGQGIITIRAYSKSETDKTKVLKTHVFDYGEEGIFKTLKKNTKDNYNEDPIDEYRNDLEILNSEFSLKDFIEPTDKFLYQQFYRDMAHYGLMNFKHLIERHNGKIIVSSVRDNNENKREQYIFSKYDIADDEVTECDITKGTSYHFEMPFKPDLFAIAEKPILPAYSDSLAVSALSNLKDLELKEYDDIEQQEADKKYLINIRVSDSFKETDTHNINNINNRIIETDVCNDIISKLSSPHIGNNYVALDFDGVILNKSNLLRILARLSREKLSDFIVYNVNYNEFIGLVEDNRQWFEKVKDKWKSVEDKKIDTSYWLKDKSILLFSRYEKTREINGKQQKEYFYFADFLFGETEKTFNSINKIVANTFPNTTYIQISTDPNSTFEVEENFSIPQQLQKKFFYDKYLLPFDIFLKNKDNEDKEKELFLFNIKQIIQNDLFKRDTYNSIVGYVDNCDGYHISNTHFKIGNKVHSSDFYYAKRLFQNSFYTTRLAMYLAKQIHNKIKEDVNIDTNKIKITLIGYEMYSELILSLTQKFLWESIKEKEEITNERITHFVAQSKNDKLLFLPEDIANSYIKEYNQRQTIIIIPIAATGSTTHKIEKEIRNRIYTQEKDRISKDKQNRKSLKEIEKEAENLREEYPFFNPRYNIILAQDPSEEFKLLRNPDDRQESIINLTAKWHEIRDCKLCYGGGVDKDGRPIPTKPLFDTDNSSLTPSLIFGNPEGQIKAQQGNEIENGVVKFNDLNFEDSIKYQRVARNENYRIYDVDSDKFVNDNKNNIIKWLEGIKNYLENDISDKLKPTDNVVIVAPCHESNSQFLNLINEIVFSSAATIIHYQNGVDFVENFSLLNKNYLTGENTKIFYVDDSLITGTHFLELFDLIRNVTEKDSPLTASILINDQAIPFIHNRAVRWSNNYFAFATYNQPPTLNITSKRPLEHERIRYELLQVSALHDTLCEHFYKKANKLNPEKCLPEETESSEKRIRRLKLFEATHKIYNYFTDTNNKTVPDLTNEEERKKFVDFKLKYKKENINIDDNDTNKKALLKVLSQYPFVLYKDLRTNTFEWHKDLIEEILKSNPDKDVCFDMEKDYDKNFSTLKFRLRRAAFLGNYQVLERDFIGKLLEWFCKIDLYFIPKKNVEEQKQDDITDLFQEELRKKEENLRDFPIFVLGNYIEMIQRNGWVAYRLLKNIEQLKEEFQVSTQGKQFLYMLQMEAASVIDDFMEMINKDYRFKWRDMYKELDNKNNHEKLYLDTDKIDVFFNLRPDLLATNKSLIIKETFLDNSDILKKREFVNYLWIKQLLYADCIDKDPYIPKEIRYQEKIDAIIEKMKGFFPEKNVQAFFIVTDGQEIPHVQYQQSDILSEFKKYYINHKYEVKEIEEEIKKLEQNSPDIEGKKNELKQLKESPDKNLYKFPEFIKFLNGTDDTQCIACETTAEYQWEDEQKQWKNIYNDKEVNLDFMPSDTQWLYLIRISELKENKKSGKEKFITQGLLGFYSSKKEVANEILPKQLLMLLRKDMSAFIRKHHKNDEFSQWVLEKEKADYTLTLNHGIDDYYNSKELNIRKLKEEPNYINSLEYFFDYLINKVWLLSTLHLPKEEIEDEKIGIINIVNMFKRAYDKIFNLQIANNKSITKEQCDKHIVFNAINISYTDLREIVSFPKGFCTELVFELLYNIKKHVIEKSFDNKIVNNNIPLIITLKTELADDILYLIVENNHYYPHNEHELRGNVHGLNLLKQVLLKHNGLKELKEDKISETNIFKVMIPLKNQMK